MRRCARLQLVTGDARWWCHNIGRGPRLEDTLFAYPITGHYRYYGSPE